MIKINHMTKQYTGFSLDISLDLPAGHITGIVGRNGAGKSTTIKAILGLIEADSGEVKVFGKDAPTLTGIDKQDIGVALAESGFSNYITVAGAAKIQQAMYTRYDEDFFMRSIREQNLPLNKPIKEFSTGMKAKLRVLTALSHHAKLLILDEPTAGLDVVARNEILDMLRSYIDEHKDCAILMTSHISSDLEGLCDDIYLIHNGKVVLHEDTEVLLGSYALLKVSDADYDRLDKHDLLAAKKTGAGYTCLTNNKQFYQGNTPGIVIENGSIDEIIVMFTSSERSAK